MRVLVIKLGALGDFAQAFAAFSRIRNAHVGDEITLLTTPPYESLAHASGLFDRIETDGRPKGFLATLKLFSRLRRAGYGRVYDLQTSSRTRWFILGFLPKPPEWSGISPGASHRQRRRDRDAMHNLDRMADQLHVAGIGPAYEAGQAPPAYLGWAAKAIAVDGLMARLGLKAPFAMLAPGASAVKPEKLWPITSYVALAQALAKAGLHVAVVGGPAETPLYARIAAQAPATLDLTGKTSLVELAALGTRAAVAVGNDSGPTHLLAYAGAPGVMLMSKVTDPNHCGPRGRMSWLKADDLHDVSVEAVLEACLKAMEAAG